MARIPLLSVEQEWELLTYVAIGREAAVKLRVIESASLSAPESACFRRQIEQGEEAKAVLWTANQRLVVFVAKRHQGRGLPLEDLIQDGQFGLLHAIEKFDLSKKGKLSTYAVWWIRQAITRAIMDKARVIRVPVHVQETRRVMMRHLPELAQDLGREPTFAEMSESAGLPYTRWADIAERTATVLPLSFKRDSEPDSDDLSSLIADPNAQDPPEEAERAELRRDLMQLLAVLGERERAIITMRWGLDDDIKRTLQQVAREFGITRERVRQIEFFAFARIRRMPGANRLKAYLCPDAKIDGTRA